MRSSATPNWNQNHELPVTPIAIDKKTKCIEMSEILLSEVEKYYLVKSQTGVGLSCEFCSKVVLIVMRITLQGK
jgi:hypothetical protein